MKKILGIIGGLVVVILIVLGINHQQTSSPQVNTLGGGDVRNVGEIAINGIGFGNFPVTVNYAGGKIGPKSNTAFWKNTTGQTVYVDLAEINTDGIASTTYTTYAYATTSAPRTIYDFSAPLNNATTQVLINGTIIATSTIATTTSSLIASPTGVAIVPNNSSVDLILTQRYTGACTGSVCETATSTNRGFNLQWRIRYHN